MINFKWKHLPEWSRIRLPESALLGISFALFRVKTMPNLKPFFGKKKLCVCVCTHHSIHGRSVHVKAGGGSPHQLPWLWQDLLLFTTVSSSVAASWSANSLTSVFRIGEKWDGKYVLPCLKRHRFWGSKLSPPCLPSKFQVTIEAPPQPC